MELRIITISSNTEYRRSLEVVQIITESKNKDILIQKWKNMVQCQQKNLETTPEDHLEDMETQTDPVRVERPSPTQCRERRGS